MGSVAARAGEAMEMATAAAGSLAEAREAASRAQVAREVPVVIAEAIPQRRRRNSRVPLQASAAVRCDTSRTSRHIGRREDDDGRHRASRRTLRACREACNSLALR